MPATLEPRLDDLGEHGCALVYRALREGTYGFRCERRSGHRRCGGPRRQCGGVVACAGVRVLPKTSSATLRMRFRASFMEHPGGFDLHHPIITRQCAMEWTAHRCATDRCTLPTTRLVLAGPGWYLLTGPQQAAVMYLPW